MWFGRFHLDLNLPPIDPLEVTGNAPLIEVTSVALYSNTYGRGTDASERCATSFRNHLGKKTLVHVARFRVRAQSR